MEARYEVGVIKTNENTYWTQMMFAEVLGSCIYVFIYLTQTDESTRLTNDTAITYIIIAAAYIVATTISRDLARVGLSPVNPQIAAGVLSSEILDGDYKYRWGWVLIVFPMLGSMLALFLFEYGYKKTKNTVREEADDRRVDSSNFEKRTKP
jgi:glycerol uptake facilitator-like aquaporin